MGAPPNRQPDSPRSDSSGFTRTIRFSGAGAAQIAGLVLNGRYRIEKELGWGGFGIVYLARDETLVGRPVVVKVLRESPPGDDWYAKKFRQEIEALARIEHPGVVGALDAGRTPDGRPFLVMQYVAGVTLREVLSEAGMEFARAGRIVRQIGQALTAAHQKGVLHRDLKPENVMLQPPEDFVKLIDFGIASILRSDSAESVALTRVAGSYDYMAPEQFQGKVSAASDVYAFAVIAYEMLAGRKPFAEGTYFQAQEQRRGTIPPPREFRADLPLAAQQELLRALAYEPARRPRAAREFGDQLADALVAPAAGLEPAYALMIEMLGAAPGEVDKFIGRSPRLRQAEAAAEVARVPSPDGVALVFFRDPAAPVQCAMEIATAVRGRAHLRVRMGADVGTGYRGAAGDSLRDCCQAARRVLEFGDTGHILLSADLSRALVRNAAWVPLLHDLGTPQRLHNLWTGDLGNRECPRKCRRGLWRLFATGR